MIYSMFKEIDTAYQLMNYYYLKNKRISKFNRIQKQRKSLEHKLNSLNIKHNTQLLNTYPQEIQP